MIINYIHVPRLLLNLVQNLWRGKRKEKEKLWLVGLIKTNADALNVFAPQNRPLCF